MKKSLGLVLKLLLVGGLLWALAQRGFLSISSTKQALMQWQYILPAGLALLVNTFATGLRWGYLLRAQGVSMRWTRILEMQFVGNFFNVALPGAVSGDVVKAIYIGKENEGKRAVAFSSILMDRVIGVSGLLVIAVIALFLSLGSDWGDQLAHSIRLFILGCGGAILAFYTYLFATKTHSDPLLRFLERLSLRFKVVGSIARIYSGIRNYSARPRVVVISLLVSLCVHALAVFSIVEFTRAFGGPEIPSLAIAVVAPLGLLITAIPITPAGVGTGHAAFSGLFHLIGSERGADVFSIFVLFTLFQSALGGLVYLRFRSHAGSNHAPLARSSQT